MKKPTLVVLAAGMGSRYGGLKQMDSFGPNGENIIDYSIYDAILAGFGKVVFVIREKFRADFEAFFSGKFDHLVEVEYVAQELDMLPEGFTLPPAREKPWGTGHAVLVTREHVDTPFAVINADDFYGREAYTRITEFFEGPNTNEDYCVVGYYLKNTLSDYGAVNRGICSVDDAQNLQKVEELVNIRRSEDGLIRCVVDGENRVLQEESVVSMNIWGFRPSYFVHAEKAFKAFLNEHIHEPKSELYIPTIVDDLINDKVLNVRVLPNDSAWFGVTYQEDKPHVSQQIDNLIEDGTYPANLWN